MVVAVAAITYGTRGRLASSSFGAGRRIGPFPRCLSPRTIRCHRHNRPRGPDGDPAVTPAPPALGGVIGAVVFRRNLWAVLVVGMLFFYITRALTA